ncbi:hypothetical protein [Actinoallomurus iriomotensis]|uniref:Uncharacterized protein n=1 Tax=Actinoallomurus iriomotensis TaxID=478107 RepID=A0A9W6S1A3_9ACTN|nr:hypothetical protein [Actinoallomurus iriomotensis]GLY86145.1 hypothetical protein Airi02_040740 [Actinoallomurus iriomotensis]
MAGWEQARRRYRLVHDVAGDVARNGPGAIAEWLPAIEAEFGDLGELLHDVQRRLHTAAEARLDALIEAPPAHPEASVMAVLDEVAETHPDLRRLVDAYASHPAVAEGTARFHRAVRAATGVDLTQVRSDRSRYEEKGSSRDRKPAFRLGLRPVCAWLH